MHKRAVIKNDQEIQSLGLNPIKQITLQKVFFLNFLSSFPNSPHHSRHWKKVETAHRAALFLESE